ncbi:prepilin peptidase [Gordonia desulfuricans]|uniref:prepilin peptidase n=1 Tax=Gordonia desulfuricans TaxID=89051 RepID=UPI000A8710E9|nr:prepilin peptidase [Gordonia desulfuricans]
MTVIALAVIAGWLALIADTDRRNVTIPNRLVVPGVLAVMVGALVHPMAAAGALIAALPYTVAFTARLSGGGDVKLAVVLGGLLADTASTLLMVFLAQVLHLLAHLAARSPGVRRPHAPALVAAWVTVVIPAAVFG